MQNTVGVSSNNNIIIIYDNYDRTVRMTRSTAVQNEF